MIGITDTEFMMARGAEQLGNEYEASVRQFQAALDEMRRERDVARRQVEKATKALAIETAHSAGLLAQVRALKAECPKSKLLMETGRVGADGTVELNMTVTVYRPAFDEKAREMGLATPELYRN
jgi:hypothetical protein